jgi:GntR family transcriptional regulator
MTVDSGGKYHEVRAHLLDLISGLPEGVAIPAERQLAADLGIARMTLRRVVDDLVAEGRLVRAHGRGTFVGQAKLSYPHELTSFSADMSRRGLRSASRTLRFAEEPAGPRLARRLNVSPDANVVRAVRLRLADDVPLAVERLHVPRSLVPDLTGQDLEQNSFYDLLAERYDITLHSAQRAIEATVTSAEEAEWLMVPQHSAAFFFERTSRDAAGTIVEYVRSVYRGDRFRIEGEVTVLAGDAPSMTGMGADGS